MVISTEFYMGQYRDDDHWEEASHFITVDFTFFSPDLSFLFCTFSVIAVLVTTSAKSSSSTLKYGLLQPGRNLYPVRIKNTSVAISSLLTDSIFSE